MARTFRVAECPACRIDSNRPRDHCRARHQFPERGRLTRGTHRGRTVPAAVDFRLTKMARQVRGFPAGTSGACVRRWTTMLQYALSTFKWASLPSHRAEVAIEGASCRVGRLSGLGVDVCNP